MDRQNRAIVVSGATGRQGGAVARHLASERWSVRAISRDPSRSAARALRRLEIDVARADMEDRASLDRVLQGAYGAFSVQNFWQHGFDAEVRQGINLADAAQAAGVAHLVYSSVGGAERDTGISHFQSKWQIEQHIRAMGIPATIVRPVFFMENLLGWISFDAERGHWILRMPMPPDAPLQMVAVTDIGGFVALVFDYAARFRGEAFELAGDQLTMPQVAAAIARHMNDPVEYVEMPLEERREQSGESAEMFAWFVREGYQANIRALQQLYPPLLTFDEWLERERTADKLRERRAVQAGA